MILRHRQRRAADWLAHINGGHFRTDAQEEHAPASREDHRAVVRMAIRREAKVALV